MNLEPCERLDLIASFDNKDLQTAIEWATRALNDAKGGDRELWLRHLRDLLAVQRGRAGAAIICDAS